MNARFIIEVMQSDVADLPMAQNGYRPRRYYLILGVVGVVFFSAAAIGSACVALWNIDGSFAQPVLAAIVFFSCWSVFILLSVWILLAYFRERLFLDKVKIAQKGIFRARVIRLEDVKTLKWRRVPQGGSIVIQTLTDRLKIYFDNFRVQQRHEVISFLHGSFAPELQEGWPQFQECYLQRRQIRRSRSAAVVCALLLFLFAGIFVYCGIAGLGGKWLIIGVMNTLGGLWYFFRVCRFRDNTANE